MDRAAGEGRLADSGDEVAVALMADSPARVERRSRPAHDVFSRLW
jgi:hypothetical protein